MKIMKPASDQCISEGSVSGTMFDKNKTSEVIQPDLIDPGEAGLRSLWIELPFDCRMKCEYCFSLPKVGELDQSGALTIDQYIGIIHNFIQQGGYWLGVPGAGEPFLDRLSKRKEGTPSIEYIMRIIEETHKIWRSGELPQQKLLSANFKKEFQLTVFTAGDLIDESLASNLAQFERLRIMVKWNSSLPQIQNALVGGISTYSDNRTQGWKHLLTHFSGDNRKRLGLVTSILAENYWEVPFLLFKARMEGVIFDCDTLLPKGRGEHCASMPTAKTIRWTIGQMQEIEKLLEKEGRDWKAAGAYVASPCHRYKNHLYIDQHGVAFPCIGCTFGDHYLPLGNVTIDAGAGLTQAWESTSRKRIKDHELTGTCSICDRYLTHACASCLGRNAFGLNEVACKNDGWVATVPCDQFTPNFDIALHGTNLIVRKIFSDRKVIEDFLDRSLESFWNPLYLPPSVSEKLNHSSGEISIGDLSKSHGMLDLAPYGELPIERDSFQKYVRNNVHFTELFSDESPIYVRVAITQDGIDVFYRFIILPAGTPFLMPEKCPISLEDYKKYINVDSGDTPRMADYCRKVQNILSEDLVSIDGFVKIEGLMLSHLVGATMADRLIRIVSEGPTHNIQREKVDIYFSKKFETLLKLTRLGGPKNTIPRIVEKTDQHVNSKFLKVDNTFDVEQFIKEWKIEKVTWEELKNIDKDKNPGESASIQDLMQLQYFDFVNRLTGHRINTRTFWSKKFMHIDEIDSAWDDWFHKWSEKLFIPTNLNGIPQDSSVAFYDSGLSSLIPRLLLQLTTLKIQSLRESRLSWALWLFYDPCRREYFRRLVDFKPDRRFEEKRLLYLMYLWPEKSERVLSLFENEGDDSAGFWFQDHVLNLSDYLRDPVMDYELDATGTEISFRALGCRRFGVKNILENKCISIKADNIKRVINNSGIEIESLDRLAQVPLSEWNDVYIEDIRLMVNCFKGITSALFLEGSEEAETLYQELPTKLTDIITKSHPLEKIPYSKVMNYFIFLRVLKDVGADHYFVGQTLVHNIYPSSDHESLRQSRNITPSGFILASKDYITDELIAEMRLIYTSVMSPFIEQFAKWSPEYDSSDLRLNRNMPCLQRLPRHYIRSLENHMITPDIKRLAKTDLSEAIIQDVGFRTTNEVETRRKRHLAVIETASNQDLKWIRMLPKADLHVHLGPAIYPELVYDLSMLSLIRAIGEDNTGIIIGELAHTLRNDVHHVLTSLGGIIDSSIYETDRFRQELVNQFRKSKKNDAIVDVNSALRITADQMKIEPEMCACIFNVVLGSLVRERDQWIDSLAQHFRLLRDFHGYISSMQRSTKVKDRLRNARYVIYKAYLSQCEHVLNGALVDHACDKNHESRALHELIDTAGSIRKTLGDILQECTVSDAGKLWKKELWGDPCSCVLSVPPVITSQEKGLERYIGASDMTGSSLLQHIETLIIALIETTKHAAQSDSIRYIELKLSPSGLLGKKAGMEQMTVAISLLSLSYVTYRSFEKMLGKDNQEQSDDKWKKLYWLPNDPRDVPECDPYILANIILAGKRQDTKQNLRNTVMTAVDSRDRYLRSVMEVQSQARQEIGQKFTTKSKDIIDTIVQDDHFGLIVPRVVGIDLVGKERGVKHADLGDSMMEAFEKCILLTIHAGEDESDRSIWEAIFALHAQRIGHGLRMQSSESLASLIRDRRIPIELCPISNQYTNGYYFRSADDYVYSEYLKQQITITINTDDPWISHRLMPMALTAAPGGNKQPYPLSNEFHVLPILFKSNKLYQEDGRLKNGVKVNEIGLNDAGEVSQLDILHLIYNSFDNTFLSAPERDLLLTLVDLEMFLVLSRIDLPYRPS